jgi:beta-N-acetylhexosaminidase
MVLVAHASYTKVTAEPTPASLSEQWITGILRKRVGYRGLVVSDDLEMGGVLQAAPIERAAVEHIRAGGDLCLICREPENVARAYRALIEEAERHPKFARRVADASRHVLAFKRRRAELRTATRPPSAAQTVKAIRALQAFNEIVARALLKREPVALEDEP